MDLQDLRERNIDTEVYDNLSLTFKDASGKLEFDNGKQINFGEQITFKISPLVEEEKISSISAVANLWLAMIWVAVSISVIFACYEASLVPTWMFVSTFQLIAHVPLVAVNLPSNAHYFLLTLLNLARFNIDGLNSAIEDISSQMSDFESLEDESSAFNDLLFNYGYRVSFARNVLFGLCLIGVTALVWLMTGAVRLLRKDASEKTRKNLASYEESMNNFMVRLLYMGFFELVLCGMINLTSATTGSSLTWKWVSVVTVVLGLIAILAVASLCKYNGPYVKGTYAEGSTALSSLWTLRALHPDRMQALGEDDDDKNVAIKTDTKDKEATQKDEVFSPNNIGGDTTNSVQCSNVPLNQQLCAAVNLDER